MRLEGALSAANAEGLGQRLRDSLARSKSRLVLDLKKLHWDKVDDLRPLREKLAAYRSRIRLVLPKMSAAHPELFLLASMFQHYQGLRCSRQLSENQPRDRAVWGGVNTL